MGQAGNRKLFDPDTQPLLLRVGLQARSRKRAGNRARGGEGGTFLTCDYPDVAGRESGDY